MKNLLLPLLFLLFLISCEKESSADLVSEENISEDSSLTNRSSNKRDVCHNGNIININVNAIPAHQAHGDAVDMDEDGYFDIDNSCSETDCDDSNDAINPGAEEICGNNFDDNCDGQIDEDCCTGVEIDFDGPLFVALEDEVGSYTWQGAIDACAAKAEAEGCDWYLPSKNELNALYGERNNIGGFDPTYYWSSTESDVNGAWRQNFIIGNQNFESKSLPNSCRCVRR